jgi:hypothetical protein
MSCHSIHSRLPFTFLFSFISCGSIHFIHVVHVIRNSVIHVIHFVTFHSTFSFRPFSLHNSVLHSITSVTLLFHASTFVRFISFRFVSRHFMSCLPSPMYPCIDSSMSSTILGLLHWFHLLACGFHFISSAVRSFICASRASNSFHALCMPQTFL